MRATTEELKNELDYFARLAADLRRRIPALKSDAAKRAARARYKTYRVVLARLAKLL